MSTKPERPTKKQVVVVGAGIAGLSCAFALSESRAFKDGQLAITVLEGSPRAGGIIETIRNQDCLLESGPDSFITNKPYMVQLAERLGIGDRIIGTEETNRGAMVVSRGRLVKLPEGFSLLAPTKILPFLESPLMSWPGKLRVLIEPFLPIRSAKNDESLADFVRRRFGPELLAKIAQPMVGGIYVGDAEKLSAAMTLERFVALEQTAGSVIGGLMKQSDNTAGGAERGVRYGLFCSFDQGMSVVVEALLGKLKCVDVRLSTPVSGLTQNNESKTDKKWLVNLGDSEIEADHVVLALPARQAAALLDASAPNLARELAQIEAASSVVVNMVLDSKDISAPLDAFGVVVPEVEMKKLGLSVIALSFAGNKFKDRAPQGKLVLRAFLGGSKNASVLDKTDEQLTALVLQDLRKLIGLKAEARPHYVRVCRWPRSMPQFQVGHRDLLDKINRALEYYPGLALAGASYRGVGLPECVHSGELCAEKILKAFIESELVV